MIIKFTEATCDGYSKLSLRALVTWIIWSAWNHTTSDKMRALIVALVAASAAAQTCPASLVSDKTTTPLAGGTLYVSDGSDADFMNIVDLGDAAVRPRVGKTRLRTV